METLFTRHKPKKGIVGLMLAGSLVLHGGLVGIASLWTPPQPGDHSIPIFIEDGPTEGPTPINTVDVSQPNQLETPATTATPEAVDPVSAPPPSSEEPLFSESSEPTPPPHRLTTVRSTASTNRSPSTQTTTAHSTGLSGGSTTGNGGTTGVVGSWVMPHPPYPHMTVRTVAGSTTVRVTTDAAGRIFNVTVVKSAGNPILDNHTVSYVRNNWHGPPNTSRTTEFVYEVR